MSTRIPNEKQIKEEQFGVRRKYALECLEMQINDLNELEGVQGRAQGDASRELPTTAPTSICAHDFVYSTLRVRRVALEVIQTIDADLESRQNGGTSMFASKKFPCVDAGTEGEIDLDLATAELQHLYQASEELRMHYNCNLAMMQFLNFMRGGKFDSFDYRFDDGLE